MPTRRLIVLIAGNFFVATSFLSVGGLLNDISISLAIPIGARAWTVLEPRYMPWVGFVFVLAALACSMLGERAAARARESVERVSGESG